MMAIDGWILARVETISTWLTEWLSISQRTQEYVLLWTWVLGEEIAELMLHVRPEPLRLFWQLAMPLLSASIGRSLVNAPAARRAAMRSNPFDAMFRLLMVALAVVSLAHWLIQIVHGAPILGADMLWQAGSIAWVTLVYLSAISSGSTRGRRRKLALEKLKSLFGTSWMPQPEGGRA